eukprot:3909062-Pleurochrysis_carterae.AAC.1
MATTVLIAALYAKKQRADFGKRRERDAAKRTQRGTHELKVKTAFAGAEARKALAAAARAPERRRRAR